jgi:hypothetical protein
MIKGILLVSLLVVFCLANADIKVILNVNVDWWV